MIGLVVTYLVGRGQGRKAAAKEAEGHESNHEKLAKRVNFAGTGGTWIIGLPAVLGGTTGGAGLVVGAALGFTVWLLLGFWASDARTGVAFVLTVLLGAWVGLAVAESAHGILPGAGVGLAFFIGLLVVRWQRARLA